MFGFSARWFRKAGLRARLLAVAHSLMSDAPPNGAVSAVYFLMLHEHGAMRAAGRRPPPRSKPRTGRTSRRWEARAGHGGVVSRIPDLVSVLPLIMRHGSP
ncbi:hypothetical protein FRACA_140051 [Frankia canadensis]|uniref:Uncharacterized protein n=1 Tax=Frankia canadensis TaxID=1836972 RepID=A0A2I2KLA5_9ACTN|nr:hypothetical protein FRACA_140051 [Frankia canadensis]SOU53742.1 hypothetical protein FRACA_140051 [Frankia canadensis]